MSNTRIEHEWNLTPKEAIALQKELKDRVRLVPLEREPKLIGGADVSMNRFAKEGFAGFVTLSFPGLGLLDHAVVKDAIPMPYIPGLLSFREIPMLVKAWEKLERKPDVLVVDGIGIAHPRRLGIASHLGLVLGIPTIGCAKSVLTGVHEEPADVPGSVSPLTDAKTGEVIGMALRTKSRVKPVFVSPGHLITLEESVELVRRCVVKHRLPEPTRFAHNTVNEYRLRDMAHKTSDDILRI
ncbi:MAG: deoxyribonuclease [Candidatus Parcubacteria bacterium]|jgi:deoxyribonuclease V|nr:deoxyribonuclease [Candidatus Parcubacteria bacterium]